MIGKRLSRHGIAALCLITLILAAYALTHPAATCGMDAKARTAVWSEPQDPYYDLAREIVRAEGLTLADAPDAALAYDPEFLIWVVSPERLSDEVFSVLGAALQRHGKIVSVGLISGSTIDSARALWQRRPEYTGRHLSIVPREEQIDVLEGGQITHHPLTIEHVVAQIERTGLVDVSSDSMTTPWTASLWSLPTFQFVVVFAAEPCTMPLRDHRMPSMAIWIARKQPGSRLRLCRSEPHQVGPE